MEIADALTRLFQGVVSRFKKHWAIISITLLAAIIRFWELGSSPPSVWYDEIVPFAAVLDQIQGHGVYYSPHVPPAYTITRLLFLQYQSILLLGHTTFAVRAPGSFYGTLIIPATYLLASTLFNKRVAFIASFLAAIGPLAIQSSRVVYGAQSTTSVFFLVVATYLFYTGVLGYRRPLARVVSSAVPFGFVIGYYFTDYGRLTGLIVLIALGVFAVRRHGLRISEGRFRSAVLYFSATFLTIVLLIPSLDVTSATQVLLSQPAFYTGSYNLLSHGWSGAITFLGRYTAFFGPQFLFFTGDPNPSQNTGLTGEFLWPSIVFFYLGLVLMTWRSLRRSNKRFPNVLVLLWTLSTPVQASAFVFNNYPTSFGVIFFIPVIDLITAAGILYVSGLASAAIARMQKESSVDSGIRHYLSRRRERILKAAAVVVAVTYVASLGVFLQAYFGSHPTETIDDPLSQWGMMYGFPEVTTFIVDHHLESKPIYVSPDGLFENNLTLFNHWFFHTKTPQNYFDFYSGGKIDRVYAVKDMSAFYAAEPSLVLTGTPTGIEDLLTSGLLAAPIFRVNRPDGRLALMLIQVDPGLEPSALAIVENPLAAIRNTSARTEVAVPQLSEVGNCFTAVMWVEIPNQTYIPDRFYDLFGFLASISSFGLRISSMSYSTTHGSSTEMTFNAYIYTNHGNYGEDPGAFAQIWSYTSIVPDVRYQVALAFVNGAYQFYVDGALVAAGTVRYPVEPPSQVVLLNGGVNATIWSVELWNVGLTGGQIGYIFNP